MICGTRSSELALAQTQLVIEALSALYPETVVKRRLVMTSGDRFSRKQIGELGEVGAFVSDIDELLTKGVIDFAVHSLKDIPTRLSDGIELVAVLPRGDPSDFLVSPVPLPDLPPGSRVGTSSLRRRAQILRLRPDVSVVPLRGNVPTRIGKVAAREIEAAVVAKAGLDRLVVEPAGFTLPITDFVPAPGQGAIAVVSREGSKESSQLHLLNHEPTRVEVEVERLVMQVLGAGCTAPVGIHASLRGNRVSVRAMVLSLDGRKCVKMNVEIARSNAKRGAKRFAEKLCKLGGRSLVETTESKQVDR
jgi:hydroxymethylbilane synthase